MTDRFKRQGFLGRAGQQAIERARVAICGLGGGGSHLVTQLAHLGVMDYALFDADVAMLWNLNRTVTLTEEDIARQTLKIDAAERRILNIRSTARIAKFACRWQDRPDVLRGRDIVFGSVDSFRDREELEATCRRYLMPLIDLGMDVRTLEGHRPRMFGQVILSMPGYPCMKCMGFLNEGNLALEAQKYGDAGDNPQVVWALGHLASAAVGVFVDLITDWTGSLRDPVYLTYRGNEGTIMPNPLIRQLPRTCPHYPHDQVGEVRFRAVQAGLVGR